MMMSEDHLIYEISEDWGNLLLRHQTPYNPYTNSDEYATQDCIAKDTKVDMPYVTVKLASCLGLETNAKVLKDFTMKVLIFWI
jgi:hypothetical protein